VIGVYGGMVDKFPAGSFMNKGLTMRTGQCPRAAPEGYETFNHKRDECVKVVLKQ
jgi:threonine dehydrogenase-like Zn-dependent dehydrogenase